MVNLLQGKEEARELLFYTLDRAMKTELGRHRSSIPLTT